MADSKKILSINEENAIFITAHFIGGAKKSGTNQMIPEDYYDIELIVNNDITCNQLMDAIRIGLEDKFDNYEDFSSKEFQDYIYNYYVPTEDKGCKTLFKDSKDKLDKDIYAACLRVYVDCYYEFYKKIKTIDPHQKYTCTVSRGFINVGDMSDGDIDKPKLYLIESDHGEKTLKELGFVSSSHINFDWTNTQNTGSLFKEDKDVIVKAFQDRKPSYNISDTPLYKLDVEPVKIIPPTEAPKKSKMNMLVSILSPLLMMGAMLVARSFSGLDAFMNYLPMMLAMVLSTVLVSLINIYVTNKNHKDAVAEWKEHYQEYINDIVNEIEKKQKWDIEQLNIMNPPVFPDLNKVLSYKDKDIENEKCLINMIREINGDIYSRNQQHPEYMSVRLGISSHHSQLVKSIFEIQGEKHEVIFSSARYEFVGGLNSLKFQIQLPKGQSHLPYLIDLPSDISNKYAYLHEAPVLVNIKECGTLGLVFDESIEFQPFLENIILNLCFYHSPEDLQFVYFAKSYQDYCRENPKADISKWEYEQRKIHRLKHLPHFRELLTDTNENKDISSFAFDKDSASKILNKILEILSSRTQKSGEYQEKHFPQIIMIFEDEYDFKRHPVSEYLREYNGEDKYPDYGINFIFCKRYFELLPKYCGQVIRATKNHKWFLLPHSQLILRQNNHDIHMENYEFTCDSFDRDEIDFQEIHNRFNRSFKILSALYYDRIEQAGDVPSSVKLFEVVNKFIHDSEKQIQASSIEKLDKLRNNIQEFIKKEWGENCSGTRDVTKSLAVPIGCRSDIDGENSLVYLDLHEKADGPHMLVAGTTGSGKTETILTYLIMLCTYFTPKQVSLLLMDMKGAGFVKRIGNLPHVVGKVTDVDGDENDTSMEYMLSRFLKSMASEVKRRKLMLSKMGVDAIDAYTKAKNNIDTHIKEVLKLDVHDATDEDERLNLERQIKEIKSLEDMPHLFLVIDEFTELMRFSNDNSDIDFKSEITSLARIGRSLGFHIILISQNIEGAITPDIRVNSKARLCLKVATTEASKEMIGRDLAASPLMPGNGRAYLLIGTGSRFEYFQSAYSGAYCIENNDKRVLITEVNRSGTNTLFYDSNDKHEDKIRKQFEQSNLIGNNDFEKKDMEQKETSDKTQISIIAQEIENIGKNIHVHTVFQSPLPTRCYYDFNNQKTVILRNHAQDE